MAYLPSKNSRLIGVMVGVALLGSSCSSINPPLKAPDYPHKTPLVLSTKGIEIVFSEGAGTPTQDRDIKDERVLTAHQDNLKDKILTWYQNRFYSTHEPSLKRAQLTIDRLCFTGARENIPDGFFEKASSDLYRAELKATLVIIDDNGYPAASAMASADQIVSVSQNASLVERDAAIANLQTTVLDSLDTALTHQIQSHMGSYLAGPL